ncbi:SOS1 (predicted) [Pycnogonum litorale]
MFAAAPADHQQPYDFESEENTLKWKGLLSQALEKVLNHVHPNLTASADAVEYIESLVWKLLGMLCSCQPHCVQDVEDRVQKTFPHSVDRWAIKVAQNAVEKGKKKNPLLLPVDKIHALLQKEVLGYKIDFQVSLYIVAILEYISADILKLATNYVTNIRLPVITSQDIKVAMCADKVLMDMFYQDVEVSFSSGSYQEEEPITCATLTYDEVVKDLIHEEKQFIRDLNMIIKVFRDPFARLSHQDLDVIFSNIMEVYEFSVNFLGSLEDTLEMTDENTIPTVGSCFEEIAENAELDVYERYSDEMVKPESRVRLNALLLHPDVKHALQTGGHGFMSAVKYVLPKLLLGPVYHCFQYFEYIRVLLKLSPTEEDRENLKQAEGTLKALQKDLEKLCSGALPKRIPGNSETSLRIHSRMSRQLALQKMKELQKSIDGWEGCDIGQCCNEFVLEGVLGKLSSSGRRSTERHVFLFDGLLIMCKQNNNRRSSVSGPLADYRLKEKYYMRKVEVIDKEDCDEIKNMFDIMPRDQPTITLIAKSPEEKNNWMAALVMLNTRSMLERNLDSILLEEEKKHPLLPPPPHKYRFSVDDSDENIIFEDNVPASRSSVPIIKGATLLKLVERLTYHMYAIPMFVRTFLTTYRSFCQPHELLDLLIERFDIPEPFPPTFIVSQMDEMEIENLKNAHREDLKRFRKDYSQPVQYRVLNVLRHWVDHHFYDFERDPTLLEKLRNFIDTVKGKSMRKWVESVNKIIYRRLDSTVESREIMFGFERTPPTIEWHLADSPETYDLMTLHPVEIARQLTLLEFDLYRAVKPSEYVGSVWTKKNKEKTSPNLLKMIHHSTNVTHWLSKCVIETENYEERMAVVSRILEIMIVLQDLNNFNGVLEIVSAINSAAVYRLEHTFAAINNKLLKALDDAKELNSDHFKKYQEKLRSINPPCVPFFGMYLTNILHIEEGNPDFLPNCTEGIINFSKRRKVAEITGEIQQYQNQPYCLSVQADIREFLATLNPLDNLTEKEFNDYLYTKSLEIEPRNCKQPPKFPRKWPELSLKSPGIKVRHRQHPLPLSMEPRSHSASTQRIHEEDDVVSSPQITTPPTPLTPLTPNQNIGSDNSVFAPVLIAATPSGFSYVNGNNSSVTNDLSPGPHSTSNPLLPPPLPPRRKRESSAGDTSPKVKQAPDAPMLPPRDPSPPPLPPRRDLQSGSTLPRMHSSSQIQARNVPSDVTLPRRNSSTEVPPLLNNLSSYIPSIPMPRRNSQTGPPNFPPPLLNSPIMSPGNSPGFANSPLCSTSLHQAGVFFNSGPTSPSHHSNSGPQLPPKTYRQNFHHISNDSSAR